MKLPWNSKCSYLFIVNHETRLTMMPKRMNLIWWVHTKYIIRVKTHIQLMPSKRRNIMKMRVMKTRVTSSFCWSQQRWLLLWTLAGWLGFNIRLPPSIYETACFDHTRSICLQDLYETLPFQALNCGDYVYRQTKF